MTRLPVPVRRSLVSVAPLVLVLGCNGAVLSGPGGGSGPAGGSSSEPDPTNPARPGMSGSTPSGGGSSSSPGGSPSSNGQCTAPAVPPKTRIWRLTSSQFKHTVKETFGFVVPSIDTLPSESRLDGFANASERLVLSSALFDFYGRIADDIASEAVKNAGSLLGCPVAELGNGTCLKDFLGKVGQKAWRRPLTDDEIGKLTKLYTTAAGDVGPEGGFKTLVQGMVLSANFLFRTELGASDSGVTKLTDHELASALSYMLWDGPPDAALLDLAAQGKLSDPEVLGREARRLYETNKAPEAMFSFVQQWLEIEDFTQKPKDMMTFPTFTTEVAKDLEDETRTFLKAVFFDPAGDKSFKTFLTANYGYLNSRTAKLYGKDATSATLAKTDLDPAQRRGFLTHGSFLAAHAEPIHTSVVARGRFMREEVLCSEVPPPPAEFKFDEKNITEDMTAREKFIEHSKNPACKGCHVMFDTIGFALENYDAVGKWRDTEKGKMIDPTGEIPLPSGGTLKFANFVDMIDQLGKGTDAYDCFAQQYLQYVTGRVKLDDCERAAVARAFADSGYKLDALVMAIVKSPSFAARTN
jgi:Protein of unknown function (DUF1592)/Protein of unknown function (DUF1588)/Protein of unknown function (DUF1595)/Protein of unknown function (DUF1587)/Protein of unknown function (DUF1585)